MNNNALLALIFKRVEERLNSLTQPSRGPRGQRGRAGDPGTPGKDFDFTEHEDKIRGLVSEAVPTIDDLSADQLEKLRGPRGRDGKDGKHGKDFDFTEHEGKIRFHINQAVPKLEDFSPEQIEKLRGPSGRDGKDGDKGRDFDFTEHEEKIKAHIDQAVPKFEDFSAEQIEKIRGPRGRDGKDGVKGKDFILSEHEESFKNWAKEFALKFKDLSDEQVESLRGRAGRDGRDGKDFVFTEHEDTFKTWAQESALKFEDFTVEQIDKLRGPRGRDGKDGKGFIFEENRESISEIVSSLISEIKDSLKLKFSDLSTEEIEQIRGPRGRDGRDGKNFVFDEHKDFFLSLKPKFSDFTPEEKEQITLKFSHLTEEEKAGLKLRFDDLTDEDRLKLKGSRGSRGQRGAPGIQGIKGDRGEQGIRGLPGPQGLRGFTGLGRDGKDGEDGKDGADAPYITDIRIDQFRKDAFDFIFEFSDGTELRTETVKIPVANTYSSAAGGGGETAAGVSSGGSGGSGSGEDYGIAKNDFSLVGVFAAGETTYTLTATPLSDQVLSVWLDGILREDYTLNGDQVSFPFDTTGQVFDAHYRYSGAITGTPKKDVSLFGTFSGGNTVYALTYLPVSGDELVVYLNGVMRTDYVLAGNLVTFEGQDTTSQNFDAYYRYEPISGGAPSLPYILNTDMSLANTEYAQVLPANVTSFTLKMRELGPAQFSFTPGGSSTNFITLPAGTSFFDENLNLSGATIYVQSTIPGQVAEILAWT